MPTIVSINNGAPVAQYQQSVPVTIADGDTANLEEFIFAGFSVPFRVLTATTLEFDAPAAVRKGYQQLSEAYTDAITGPCTFNITHPIRVPAIGASVDDDSLLAGIGNAKNRYAKVTLSPSFELAGPEITSVNIQGNAKTLICARYGVTPGAEGKATVEVLNNTGITQSYDVKLVAGANNTGIAPVLTVYGGSPKQISLGQAFTPSFSAVDDSEGDISERVVVTGTVNVNVAGDYPLLFTVQDSFGNEATATQTIQVRQNTRYELRLLASLDQNVQSVTGSYAGGVIVAENGAFGACSLGTISLVNGETVITQANVIAGSIAALVAGGTTTVTVVLIDDAKNVAALPRNIPITSVAM